MATDLGTRLRIQRKTVEHGHESENRNQPKCDAKIHHAGAVVS